MRLRIRVYDGNDNLQDIDSAPVVIKPGREALLGWILPDTGGQPIGEIGLALSATGRRADGRLILDFLRWDGAPDLTLRRPDGDGDFWRRAWVNGASFFSKRFPAAFRISQAVGEGVIIHGTRQWTNYEASGEVMMHLGNYGGMAFRVQGLRRYYCGRVTRDGKMQIIRAKDQQIDVGSRVQLAAAVAANGDQRQRGRQIKLAPEFAQHLVDKAAAFDEQSRCVTVGCEMLAYGALSFLQVGLEVRDQGVVGKHFRLHRSRPGGT